MVLALACAAQFMVVLDIAIVNVALPSIQRDLDAGQSTLQWVVIAYGLLLGGFLLLGGRMADLLGRRRILVTGMTVFSAASLVAGVAQSTAVLIAARGFQGFGAALVAPAALSILAIAIRDQVDWDDAETWLSQALLELQRTLDARPGARGGPNAALYSCAFFESHIGEVVAFVPVTEDVAAAGQVALVEIPAADLAVLVHQGSFADLDQAYGALGTFVAERVLAADGPIREHYLVTDADDPGAMCTEVCWPIRHIPEEA
jgi:effector-binding domain-containing protein